jgi:hypothetical protein
MDSLTFTFTSTDGGVILPGGGGGVGDIINGGQPGPVTIGTTDATATTITSGADIQIGDAGSADEIHLNGSLSFQYELLNNAVATETLDDSHYFVEIASAMTTTVQLPAASIAAGRQYVIVNGKATGELTVVPNGGDTIDGETSHVLQKTDWRFTLMSNGGTKWLIV